MHLSNSGGDTQETVVVDIIIVVIILGTSSTSDTRDSGAALPQLHQTAGSGDRSSMGRVRKA